MKKHLFVSGMLVPRRHYLVALFVLAFLLRFGVVLGLRDIHKFHGRRPAGADAVEFNDLALNLDAGKGYAVTPGHPTAFRAPGFPLFVAGLYRISYQNYPLAYVSLCIVGALTCLATYLLAWQLLSEEMARLTGFLAAIYLPYVYFSSVFLSEVLFALCVAVGLWLLLRYFENPSVKLLVAAGLSMGYAALTRPIAVLFPLFLFPALWAAPGTRGWRPLARMAILLAATAVVMLPWWIRNYEVFHRFVPTTTNGGSTFYGSNNDVVLHDHESLGSWVSTRLLPGREKVDAAPDEVSHDQVEWGLGKKWVETHPADLPLLLTYKMARFWLPDTTSGNRKFVLMQVVTYTPFAVLILVGLFFSLRGKGFSPPWLAVHGILAANLVSTLLFYGSARFRDSITPVLMIYAALGIDGLLALLAARRVARPDHRG